MAILYGADGNPLDYRSLGRFCKPCKRVKNEQEEVGGLEYGAERLSKGLKRKRL